MTAREPFALATFAVSAVLTAIGTFSGDDDHQWRQWLIVLGIAAVATLIVFWVIVPRVNRLGRGALILAILGAIAIIVFWLGIPVVLAGGAAFLGLEARRARTQDAGLATPALALAGLTVAAAVVFAFVG
jgi:hypothetical protein